jgi:uncharacterized membrane protein
MNRHDLDVTSLVFGLMFAGVVGLWAAVVAGGLPLSRVPVVLPLLLVAAGLAGIVAAVSSARRQPALPAHEEELPPI